MSQHRTLFKKAAVFFLLGNLAAYILFHLSYTLMLEEGGIYFEYARLYLADAVWGFVMPVSAAALALFVFAHSGIKCAVAFLTLPALCRLAYSLPYYYIYYVSLGFDSLESLPLMLIASAAESIILFAYFMLLLFVGVLFSGRGAAEERREAIYASLDREKGGTPSAAMRALFAISLFVLIISLSRKLFDVVVFVLEYGFDLLFGEVLLMMLDLIIPILLFLISMIALAALVKRLAAQYKESDSE